MSLIAYTVSHPSRCDCSQCEDFGGVKELLKMYQVSDFPDLRLRKIYAWLKMKFPDCLLQDLDFEEAGAPLLSLLTECCVESMVYEPIYENVSTEFTNSTAPINPRVIGQKYLKLKDILI
jgi:hypothetical protein